MTFYKYTDEKMRSNGIGIPEPLRIQYKIGEWIEPKVGKIFVTTDKFLNEPRCFVVEVRNPIRVRKILSIWAGFGPSVTEIENYWKDPLNHYHGYVQDDTYICEAVRLINEIL